MKKILCFIMMLLIITGTSYANSAGPPVIVIISDGPDDLEANFVIDGEYVECTKIIKGKEVLFQLTEYEHFYYPSEIESVHFSSSEKTFIIPFEAIEKYNNIFTLDYNSETINEGKDFVRTLKIVSFRLISTLIIEAILFTLFRYKEKRSWLVFLIINLITQFGLNIALLNEMPTSPGMYLMISLVLYEFIIFFTEAFGMTILINEKKRWITFTYVMISNIASLTLGMVIYPLLPF